MRKIESQMCEAIQQNINWKTANTEVMIDKETNTSSVYLHGNLIATVTDNDMTITMVVGNLSPQSLALMHFARNFVLLAKVSFRKTFSGLFVSL